MFTPQLAEIRFGCGLSPVIPPPESRETMLELLAGPDSAAERFAIPGYPAFQAYSVEAHALGRARRASRGTPEFAEVRKQTNLLKKRVRIEAGHWTWMALQRRAHTRDGLRERLAAFWADHFTAVGKSGVMKRGMASYVETAIRPHLTGSFAEMLKAVATQPLMLHYLDQKNSLGPGSDKAARRGKKAGLNENLAREMLELHTLGVDGGYDQRDVRELAELLTGLTYRSDRGFSFRKDFAEPGPEVVLGRSYGSERRAHLGEVLEALDDLARHPETARHMARKLAVHFLGDAPDASVTAHLEARYNDTGGDLGAVTAALLEHPAAWDPAPGNVKQPVDYLGSALRALAVPEQAIDARDEKIFRQIIDGPLTRMGQPWMRPLGPDGWPEADGDWIAPQRLAARIEWGLQAPGRLLDALPDPREFVETALGARAGEAVRFAARAAESRGIGLALILASPEFQRM